MLTADWLADWATQCEAATARALRDVLSTVPYEPGDHQVGPPASGAELTVLRQRQPSVPDALLALHRHVGPVSLPDIGNGYFLHPIDDVMTSIDDNGRPDQIGQPFPENIDILVFGGNGGGDLYAIASGNGRVLRLRDAEYHHGIYHGIDSGITVLSQDLRNFLERLLAAVTTFAASGSVTDL